MVLETKAIAWTLVHYQAAFIVCGAISFLFLSQYALVAFVEALVPERILPLPAQHAVCFVILLLTSILFGISMLLAVVQIATLVLR